MGTTQPNENLTQNFVRAFTQRGGPGPSNALRYAGADEQYLMVGDIANPDRSGVNALNVNDPRRRGLFTRSGVTIDPPDIPSNSLTFKQRFGGVPWYKFKLDCPLNVYESEGLCNDPADPINGWITLQILSQGLSTDKSYNGRTPFDGSDESQTEIGFSWLGGIYTIGGIVLGETASVDVTTEVIDIVYGSYQNCSNCGVPDNGTRRIYALQQTAGGSSAVVGKVLYSTDYGATWASSAITGLGVGALVTAIDIVGRYLVVIAKGENAYYISPINQLTGVPGAWTKVTTGFVAAKTPNDLYVESPNRVYFVGDGGYIYVSTNITAGVSICGSNGAGGATTQNLLRIHGQGPTLLAVGAGNVTLKSTNRGQTWAATTASVTGTVQADAVYSQLTYWVGTSAGVVYVTEKGGEDWNAITLPGAAVVGIHDIVWASAEVGYIAATRAGPTAVVFATFDGGANWDEAPTSQLPTAPTYGRPNRLAVPNGVDLGVMATNLAVAALSGGLIDGAVFIGSAPVL